MKKKILKALLAVAIILPMIGGTCGPPSYYTTGVCGRPTQGAPHVEEIASIVRITNRPSHDCTPDLSPCGKFVAFASWEPKNYYDVPSRNHIAGDFDIMMVGANGGGGYQRITNNPGDDYYPAWFPSGKEMMITSERSGYPAIWIKPVTGIAGTRKLSWAGTSDFGGDVGNRFIVFASADRIYNTIADFYWYLQREPMMAEGPGHNPYMEYDPPWHPRWHPRIFRVDRNGARLTDLGPGIDPQISPDGKKIVFSSVEAGSWDIWIMEIDGKRRTQMTTYTGNETDPCWSPDGKWIAYSKSSNAEVPGIGLIEDEYWNIWVTNATSGENIQKTFSRWFRDLSPCWGYVDEGDHFRDSIYFHSDRDNYEYTGFDIYRLDPDMGIEQYDLPDLPDGRFAPSVSKGGPTVRILNGTRSTTDAVPKWAARVTEKLQAKGYNCLEPKNTFSEVPNYIKVYYRGGYYDFAMQISRDIPDVPNLKPALRKMPSNFRWKEADVIVVLGK